jgi:hypothetical protein
MLEMEIEEGSQGRRANLGRGESHRAIGGLRGRPLGVVHVGFDEFEGEPAEFRKREEGGGGGGRGRASGVGTGGVLVGAAP